MALTQAQQARQLYAGAVHAKRPPDVIAEARRNLEYAKAEQAIASWSTLALIDRARLAAKLLAGDGSARAT